MSYKLNQSRGERNPALDRSAGRAEVGRSRFFAGVPGRPARTAPAVRPLPFFTPGSQSYRKDDGLDRGVGVRVRRVRVGDYLLDMRVGSAVGEHIGWNKQTRSWRVVPDAIVGAHVGEPITATVAAASAAITIANTAKGFAASVWNTIKGWFTSAGAELLKQRKAANTKFNDENMVALDQFVAQVYDMESKMPLMFHTAGTLANYTTVTGTTEQKSFAYYFYNLRENMRQFRDQYGRLDPGIQDAFFYLTMLIGGPDWPERHDFHWDAIKTAANLLSTIAEAYKAKMQKAVNDATIVITVPSGLPTLKSGSSGDSVKSLQTFLNVFGYGNLEVNGKFNASTVAAVKAFQVAAKLTADGIVGTNTWAAITSRLGGMSARVVPTTDANGNVTVTVVHPDNTVATITGGNLGVVTTPGGGAAGGGGGGGTPGGGTIVEEEVPFYQKPLFWGLAVGTLLLVGGGTAIAVSRAKKKNQ